MRAGPTKTHGRTRCSHFRGSRLDGQVQQRENGDEADDRDDHGEDSNGAHQWTHVAQPPFAAVAASASDGAGAGAAATAAPRRATRPGG